MDGNNAAVDRILAEAACLVRREKEAAGDAEPADGYKEKQISCLKDFGGENEVFAGDEDFVVKLNNFAYAGDDLTHFFIRIEAHNRFFGNVPYDLIGFAYNGEQEFCAVLVQPYVQAKREATEQEIQHYMQSLGFVMDYVDEYHNETYEIFDAVPNNVLCGIDNQLYFIDTQIRMRR